MNIMEKFFNLKPIPIVLPVFYANVAHFEYEIIICVPKSVPDQKPDLIFEISGVKTPCLDSLLYKFPFKIQSW